MTPGLNPVIQQRHLRTELRRARTDAALSQQQVADELDWSLSKVIRIEHGAVRVSITDLRAMLNLYKVEGEKVEELLAIARLSRQTQWWDKYRKTIGSSLIQWIELEAAASRLRQFQATTIPGLLQTREYARAIMSAYVEGDTDLEPFITVRLQRQHVLEPVHGKKFVFLLDEATLRRRMGSAETTREQVARLREVNRQSNVSIRIVRFNAGYHRAMAGSFTLVDVPVGDEDDVDYSVLQHTSVGDNLIRNDPQKTSDYDELFDGVLKLATPEEDTDALLAEVEASHK